MSPIIITLFALSFAMPALAAVAVWATACDRKADLRRGRFVLHMVSFPAIFVFVHVGFASWVYPQYHPLWGMVIFGYLVGGVLTVALAVALAASLLEAAEKREKENN